MAPTRTTCKQTIGILPSGLSKTRSTLKKDGIAKRKAEVSPPKLNKTYKNSRVCDESNQENIPATKSSFRRGLSSIIKPSDSKSVVSKLPIPFGERNGKVLTSHESTNVSHAKGKSVINVTKVKPLGPSLKVNCNESVSTKQKPVVKALVQSKVSVTTKSTSTSVNKPTAKIVSKKTVVPKISSDEAVRTRPTTRLSASKSGDTDGSLYTTALEEIFQNRLVLVNSLSGSSEKEIVKTKTRRERKPPPGVEDYDKSEGNLMSVSTYAFDIFEYLKSRESFYKIDNYMPKQKSVNAAMRATLVDWLVQVQENLVLNHETLYLGVKIVDKYLMHSVVQPSKLQLIGCTAIFVASKYDERLPPLLDDFVECSNRKCSSNDIINLEEDMYKALDFNLGFPLSYRFLRRYARCARVEFSVLTLARYILELSLMEYNMLFHLDSKIACAALYLALVMSKLPEWSTTLEYYSGYKVEDFKSIAVELNEMLHKSSQSNLSTVRSKYSHSVFFKVSKVPLINLGTMKSDSNNSVLSNGVRNSKQRSANAYRS